MHRRAGAAALGLAATAGLLSACDKPTPQVTFLANNTVTRAAPQTFCLDSTPNSCRNPAPATNIKARSGSTILVDVPRSVAQARWQVSAGTVDQGKFTAIDSPGASSGVTSSHSVRVTVPVLTGAGSYVLLVGSVAGGRPATWVAQVTVTQN